MRSDITKRIKEYRKDNPINERPKLSLDEQLGFWVGEFIVCAILPTLSTSSLQSNRVIEVSNEDMEEHERLDKIWSDKINKNTVDRNSANKEWNELLKFNKMLEQKYLPATIEYLAPTLYTDYNDEVAFKKGMASSLWDCDMCCYSTDSNDIIIDKIGNYYAKITLKLKTDYKLEKED